MPTKLTLTIKIADDWVDASHVIDKDYVWHRSEKICNWYAGKLKAVTKPDQAQFKCKEQVVSKNVNFLYSKQPDTEVAPVAVLILGVIIAIMAYNVWKKM